MRRTLFALRGLAVLAALAVWLVDTGRWTPARPDRAPPPRANTLAEPSVRHVPPDTGRQRDG